MVSLKLGYFGFVVYLAAVAYAFIASIRAFRLYRSGRNLEAANIVALAVSVQLLMAALETASDSHNGFAGMWFWYSLFLASGFAAPSGGRVASSNERRFPLRVRLRQKEAQVDEPAVPRVS